jgi:hypothetical protein
MCSGTLANGPRRVGAGCTGARRKVMIMMVTAAGSAFAPVDLHFAFQVGRDPA